MPALATPAAPSDRSSPASPSRLPAPLLFFISGISLYMGAALAVNLFHELSPSAVAWLRLFGAAVVLLAWRRPRVLTWNRRRLVLAGVFGMVTAVMNIAFYEAVARIPLGTAVAMEFIGPVAVAAFGSRTKRDFLSLALVTLGVALIANVEWKASPLGLLLIGMAAILWAGYIILGKRVATGGSGIDDLAVGAGVATVLLSPIGLLTAPVWSSGRLLLLGMGVGVLSSVIPYGLDQVVLARVGRERFALLLALLPLTATLIGVIVLRQIPHVTELLGALAVMVGVVLGSRPSSVSNA
ncbi:EamA family transporter [Pendulispora brunnea]|uniref:EamA family transporter n=1 Tax=Pendulispora brunnea TaxID=2905690 RepID=A0ABZ2JU50_9BACT